MSQTELIDQLPRSVRLLVSPLATIFGGLSFLMIGLLLIIWNVFVGYPLRLFRPIVRYLLKIHVLAIEVHLADWVRSFLGLIFCIFTLALFPQLGLLSIPLLGFFCLELARSFWTMWRAVGNLFLLVVILLGLCAVWFHVICLILGISQ